MDEQIKTLIGQRIKIVRKENGLTQKEFYKTINGNTTSNATSLVCRIETGISGISAETAWNIIKAFPDKKYRLQWLLGFDDCMTEGEYFTRYVSEIGLDYICQDCEYKIDIQKCEEIFKRRLERWD